MAYKSLAARLTCASNLWRALERLDLLNVSGAARRYSNSAQRSSLYTAENPTGTRQRLFGDIAPVYDEVSPENCYLPASKLCGHSRVLKAADSCPSSSLASINPAGFYHTDYPEKLHLGHFYLPKAAQSNAVRERLLEPIIRPKI